MGEYSPLEVAYESAYYDTGSMTKRPVLTHTREELAAALKPLTGSRALVMTMGALHSGHLELVKQAKAHGDHVIVTIFVNPTQFAPGEDYDAYPRTLEADMDALETVGADVVWAPSPEDAYPEPVTVSIDPGPIARVLEGKTRPTHFGGVALVCTKVMGLVCPDVALFGEKDAQQLAMLRHVFRQLDVPVTVIGVPIVRDADGVALSSRNRYLSDEERVRARALNQSLTLGVEAGRAGAPATQIIDVIRGHVEATGDIDIDYIALVDDGTFDILGAYGSAELTSADSLRPATLNQAGEREYRLLLAVKVGATRLIDNMPFVAPVEQGNAGE